MNVIDHQFKAHATRKFYYIEKSRSLFNLVLRHYTVHCWIATFCARKNDMAKLYQACMAIRNENTNPLPVLCF